MGLKKPPKGIGLYIVQLKDGTKKYQSRLWNPHLARVAKKKTWQSSNLNEVIQTHLNLKEEYARNNYDLITETPKKKVSPSLILECAALYEKYLNDDLSIIPEHKAKKRSTGYIKDQIHYIKTFLNVLQSNGYKLSHTHISAINDDAVALYYNHLEARYTKEEIGSVTWNKSIKACRQWIKVLKDEFNIEVKNSFISVTAKPEATDPQFLEPHELLTLLKTIKPELGWGTRGTQNHRFNYYRDWLPTYLLVSAFIGGRPNEIANLKWSDVGEDYIDVDNSKVNNRANAKKSVNYVFIHPELATLLAPLRAKSESDDDYILVPDQANRKSLFKFVSKAFTHFMRLSDIKKEVTLSNLRHTYINALYNLIGEEGLSVHHKKETAVQYYLSKRKKFDIQQGKRLFEFDFEPHLHG